MKNANYIRELAKGNLSLEGYSYISSLLKYLINKYNWPKIIIDEKSNTDNFWTDDEILSFTQQILLFVLEKGKLKNYQKIPDNYIQYYFNTVIVSYVADKIKQYQNKIGLSFDDTKRIALEILRDQYYKSEIKSKNYWNIENKFENPILNNETIENIIGSFPKIPITEKTKHYKPRVKTAINDIFSLVKRPINQDVLFNQIYKLFDQSSFAIDTDEDELIDVREDKIQRAVTTIIKKIEKSDKFIFLDYFFSQVQISLNTLAQKHKIPKSTAHHKVQKFTAIVSENFTPLNEQEGMKFLEKLHKSLDDL